MRKNAEKLQLSSTAGGNAKWPSHFGKQFGVPKNVKHRVTIWLSILLLGITQKNENICSHKNLYTDVYSSSHYIKNENSPNVHQLMSGLTVVHPYNGILFSHKKEWSPYTCYNMHERIQIQKATNYMISLILNFQNRKIHTDWKYEISDCLGLGEVGMKGAGPLMRNGFFWE